MRTTNSNNYIDILHSAPNVQSLSITQRLWRLVSHPQRIPQVIKRHILGKPKVIDWDSRVNELGAYSVIDTRHTPDEYEYVTKRQKEILYPHFLSKLNGDERSVLDFGCGAGRFTADLAEMINGEAIGTDVTQKLINICPANKNVSYICSERFFEENKLTFDAIWVSLVLGGLPDNELSVLAKKIEAAVVQNGLLFLVESTGERYLEGLWRIRTRAQLTSLFPLIQLQHIGSYYDVNQEISILAGRKSQKSV
jgi:SAM-dependent methyltransferase